MPVASTSQPPPERQPIADVVGRWVSLLPLDPGQLQGICPFCGSSAFRVRPAKGTFHCFGCGQGGDGAAFTTAIHHDRGSG